MLPGRVWERLLPGPLPGLQVVAVHRSGAPVHQVLVQEPADQVDTPADRRHTCSTAAVIPERKDNAEDSERSYCSTF